MRDQIHAYSSKRGEMTKREVMRRFREQSINILITTEAAGMVRAENDHPLQLVNLQAGL
jgi:hypothetical protein